MKNKKLIKLFYILIVILAIMELFNFVYYLKDKQNNEYEKCKKQQIITNNHTYNCINARLYPLEYTPFIIKFFYKVFDVNQNYQGMQ